MREDDEKRESRRRAAERLGGGDSDYAPGAAAEVTLPATDEWQEVQDHEEEDIADAAVGPEVLRDGGPTRNRGVVTTTGGTAGPASVRRRPRAPGGDVAPTTTGDATTGGLGTPTGGATSDQSTHTN
ncbi:hypothetical protein GCM10027280_17680 [Micromonospora polyrhachis]|uniref:DUF5709 domain-containing protein n=1 Tax=Micromonospora polyrhachis TaxID=1282883 RepID=A0A7W7WM70_9ACTN|nr:hypothetical protein [Micromonospora polyrhachis]MBB4956866.1 hypothetical protein [Micromonospora polyrhachis]